MRPVILVRWVRPLLLIRRVVGVSMLPSLAPGDIVCAWAASARIRPGDIVVVRHDGLEKIKRVSVIDDGRVYVVGDNAAASTDSRDFGWLDESVILGRVWWPRSAARPPKK